MSNVTARIEIRKLPRKILSRVENEFLVLKDNHPELIRNLDDVYRRLRKGILDDIGDTEREISGNPMFEIGNDVPLEGKPDENTVRDQP